MATRRRVLAAGVAVSAAWGAHADRSTSALEATPGPASPAPLAPATPTPATPVGSAAGASVDVVVRGLVNPRGFTWLPDGRMVVAEAGSGGPTARVVAVEADGALTELLGGFPTARVVFRGISGIADVKLGAVGEIYALVAGGDADRDLRPNGLYRLDGLGGADLVADLSAFIAANPVANLPGDYDADGQPYRLLPTPAQDGFYVSEGNSCQVLRMGLNGSVARVADLSTESWIPTGLAQSGEELPLVATFTAAPFTPGSATVRRILPDGATEPVWTGLTMVTDLAYGPGPALYAVEMATGVDAAGVPVPNSGRLVRLTTDRPNAPEVLVEGLHYPAHVRAGLSGPEGDLPTFFVSGPTLGSDDGSGTILRITVPAHSV